jgi:hypothetical protein
MADLLCWPVLRKGLDIFRREGEDVECEAREALKACSFGKWNLENLFQYMEIDSSSVSGKCAAILHEPLRMPQQTFRV